MRLSLGRAAPCAVLDEALDLVIGGSVELVPVGVMLGFVPSEGVRIALACDVGAELFGLSVLVVIVQVTDGGEGAVDLVLAWWDASARPLGGA